jgi:hypothetical protein
LHTYTPTKHVTTERLVCGCSWNTEHPTEILRRFSQSSVALWDSISNYVTTASFHTLSNSFFNNNNTVMHWVVTYKTGFLLDDWIFFAPYTFTHLGTTGNSSGIAILHTVTHTLGFSGFTSRILATDLSQSVTSNHTESFLCTV